MIDDRDSKDTEELEMMKHSLQRVLRFLHLYRQVAATTTASVIVMAIVAIPAFRTLNFIPEIYLGVLLTFAFVTFMALLRYDTHKRAGDAIYEEVSDELQWHLTREVKGESPQRKDRPELEMRVLLREYAIGTDLPLVRGPHGPMIYSILVIVSLVFYVVITYSSMARF